MWLLCPSLTERMLTLNLGNGSPYQNDNSQKQQRPQLQISFHLYGFIGDFCLIVFTTIDIFHSYYGIVPPVKTLYVKNSSHTAWNNDDVRMVGKQHLYSLAPFSDAVLLFQIQYWERWPVQMTFGNCKQCIQGSPQPWPFTPASRLSLHLTFHTRNLCHSSPILKSLHHIHPAAFKLRRKKWHIELMITLACRSAQTIQLAMHSFEFGLCTVASLQCNVNDIHGYILSVKVLTLE